MKSAVVLGLLCLIGLSGCKYKAWWIGVAMIAVLLVGCGHTGEVVGSAATAVMLTPASVAYGSSYRADNLSQASTIMLGAKPETFSDEISLKGMVELSQGFDASGLWVEPEWKYMGTKHGHHFLAYYAPLLDMRRIYRIRESEFAIQEPFELRAVDSEWRALLPAEAALLSRDWGGERARCASRPSNTAERFAV